MQDNIVALFSEILAEYATEVVCLPVCNGLKYIITLGQYDIEILYEIMDNCYQIRMEKKWSNAILSVVFLTRSREFQKEMKRSMRESKFKRKRFADHMRCFANMLKFYLDAEKDLSHFEHYESDLDFDGIVLSVL